MPTYAPFGEGIFNEFDFGIPPNVTFSSGITAIPYGYNGVYLTWQPIAGSYNEMRLVRSSFGFPATPWDGVTLLDQTSGYSINYLDQPAPSGLKSGLYYYYTLFVFSLAINAWVSAGSALSLVLSPLGSGALLADLLPEMYMDMDSSMATQAQPSGPLTRYLGLLGRELDWIRSEINQLLNVNDIDLVRGDLLPLVGYTFGVAYEPILGMSKTRRLLKNITHAYKSKGTTPGIATVASSFSGFGAIVTAGKNLEVQLDESTADLSVGLWNNHRGNCTLSVSSAVSPQHSSYQPVYGSTGNTILITSVGSGAVSISTSSSADVQTTGIPVTPGQQVVVSGYFRAASVGRNWVAQADWYNAAGILLSSSVGSAVADTTSGFSRPFVAATAPANAAYLGRTFSASGLGATEGHYFDAEQVEVGTTPSTWDPPRDIKVNLFPVRQNLVPNPSFEANTTSWSFVNATAPASATPPHTPIAGSKAVELVATANGNITATSSTIPITAGNPFFLSAYFLANTTVRNVFVSLVWQLSVGGPTTVNGNPVAESNSAWTARPIISGVAPSNATGVQVVATVQSAVTGEIHWLDAVLLEPSNFLNPYFDGNFSPASDYLWEGTPNNSVSDYYPQLQTKLTRLGAILPAFVPLGATFSLQYGAAAFAAAGLIG